VYFFFRSEEGDDALPFLFFCSLIRARFSLFLHLFGKIDLFLLFLSPPLARHRDQRHFFLDCPPSFFPREEMGGFPFFFSSPFDRRKYVTKVDFFWWSVAVPPFPLFIAAYRKCSKLLIPPHSPEGEWRFFLCSHLLFFFFL